MINNVFFISGIDTGCGKTYITGMLAKAFLNKGINVITQKLVQTGCVNISEDITEHRRLMNKPLYPEDINKLTCPYIFSYPASPHLSAKLENKTIDIDLLTDTTIKLSGKFDMVLVEGAGGLHVPLNNNFRMIDYIAKNNYPLLLVSSSKLGSINHTLLSIEACVSHNINLHVLIYNRLPDTDNIIADDTFEVIKKELIKHYPTAKMIDYKGMDENFNELINFRNL